MSNKLTASSQNKIEKRASHKTANALIKKNRKELKEENKKPPELRKTKRRYDKVDFPLPKKRGR